MQSLPVILFCVIVIIIRFAQPITCSADIVCCVQTVQGIQGTNSSGQGMCKIFNLTIVGNYFEIVSRCFEACLRDPECSAYEYYSSNATECTLVHENITECYNYLVPADDSPSPDESPQTVRININLFFHVA